MTYFHATTVQVSKLIVDYGCIKKDSFGTVYLSDSITNAAKFLAVRGVKDIVVFEITGLERDKINESFDHSENFFKCKAWTYEGDIPIKKVKSIHHVKVG